MYEELIGELHLVASGVQSKRRRELLERAADAIEELQRQIDAWVEPERKALIKSLPKWIPVTERLPEHEYGESTSVLAVDLYGVMRVVYYDGGNWCWQSGEALSTTRVALITHWMPLPNFPEPQKEET